MYATLDIHGKMMMPIKENILTSLTLSLNVSRILKLDMLGIMCYIMEVKHGDYYSVLLLAKTAVKHNCCVFVSFSAQESVATISSM